MSDSMTLLAVILIAGYGLLLLILMLRRRARRDTETQWLMLTLIVALIGAAFVLLPADAHTDGSYEVLFVGELTQPAVVIIVANLMLVLFGFHLLRFLGSKLGGLWLAGGLIWWAAQAVLSTTTEGLTIGTQGWYRYVYDPVEWPNTLAFAGWLVLGVLLMLAALYAFYRARLPEIANRALFAELLIIPVFLGVVIGTSDENLLTEAGRIVQWVGLAAAVYGVVIYRLFDIRRMIRNLAATGVLTVLTALVIFIALIIAQELDPDTEGVYA
ncbi:MAG: hypothetical protein K8S97_03330, partial [Anaerolineae bacterium]|nr:hypothetical protein [Anaerolineae bacterium]